jgi:hypothetical protein
MPSDDSKRKQKYERPAVKRVGLNGLPAGIQRELVTLFREQPAGETIREGSPPVYRILLTLEGRFIEIPVEFCRLLAYGREELIGKPIEAASAPRMASFPRHVRSVFHFGDFQGLWMFMDRAGLRILTRCEWELLGDMSIEIRAQRVSLP